MKKLIETLLATGSFIVLLFVVYFIHIRYLNVNVVFYAAIADVFVAAIVSFFLVSLLGFFRLLGSFERFLLIIVWLLAGYSFAISVPTVIDRSLSFYILEKLQQRGGAIKEDRMADVFTKEYMKEHRLVDVRLTEQLQSGTITIQNGCVSLTEKGKTIAAISRYFRMNLLPKHRLLMGEYSDDLTNPFKNSIVSPDYLC